jgi:hypothetical protein
MSGIFVSKGMGLRIPAGALTISIGEDGKAEVSLSKVEVSLDFWDHWLEVARDRAIEAVSLHRQLLAAHRDNQDEVVSDLFGKTLRTSMTCMGALGFSLDALYSSVKERLPANALHGIGSNSTARHQFVHETLKRSARLSNDQAKLMKSVIKQIFYFRDSAVHPPGGWSEPMLHPDLGTSMASGYVAFRATNAAKGYVATRHVIELVLTKVRPKHVELAEWAAGARQRLPDELPPEVATVKWADESENDGSDASGV